MKKVGHRCWIARGAQSELWFYEEEMLCYVNEKIIWEGWKSLGRRCLGQGGDSQIYEGDKGVWGCQQATKRGRSLQKCKTRKSWRERKDPNPPRWWLLVELELGKQAIKNYWNFLKKKRQNHKEKSTFSPVFQMNSFYGQLEQSFHLDSFSTNRSSSFIIPSAHLNWGSIVPTIQKEETLWFILTFVQRRGINLFPPQGF